MLFLDELPEFPQTVLEVLRQPLEDRVVTISRASGTLTFPSNFILVAAQNPCPCGYYGDSERACTCAPATVARSGALWVSSFGRQCTSSFRQWGTNTLRQWGTSQQLNLLPIHYPLGDRHAAGRTYGR